MMRIYQDVEPADDAQDRFRWIIEYHDFIATCIITIPMKSRINLKFPPL